MKLKGFIVTVLCIMLVLRLFLRLFFGCGGAELLQYNSKRKRKKEKEKGGGKKMSVTCGARYGHREFTVRPRSVSQTYTVTVRPWYYVW